MNALNDSDFYNSIYIPIISFGETYKNNIFISKCIFLVEELYRYYLGIDELNLFEKDDISEK